MIHQIENVDVSEIENPDENETVDNKKEKLTLNNISKYINSMKTLIPYWYILQNPDDSDINISIKAMLQKLNR